MRIHYVLTHGGDPASKLADVEIHFEEGLLAGLKLVGCSIWRSNKGGAPTVLVPSRSYATAYGVRYYELLRPSADNTVGKLEPGEGRDAIKRLKEYILGEYRKIVPPESEPEPSLRERHMRPKKGTQTRAEKEAAKG